MKIAIAGKRTETENYVKYIESIGVQPIVTLSCGEILQCDGLLLPGGGDITPAFFGEKNHGSRHIDTELDILQLQALELCIRKRLPVLGICKGLQLLNVGLGGSLIQELPYAERHRYADGDQYHSSVTADDTLLRALYGAAPLINSAHHQGIGVLGNGLIAVQWCPDDYCIEAVLHKALPLIGVQWHPERIDETKAKFSGKLLLDYFASLCAAASLSS